MICLNNLAVMAVQYDRQIVCLYTTELFHSKTQVLLINLALIEEYVSRLGH